MLKQLKKRLKPLLQRNPITKAAFLRWQKKKSEQTIQVKLNAMHKNGVQTILHLQQIFEKSGLSFFFDMGTLLGIVREGRILGHDLDIDMAVYVKNEDEIETLKQLLESHGCAHQHRFFVIDIGIVEDSYERKGIKFDVNYYHKGTGEDICYLLYRDPQKTYADSEMSVVKLTCTPIEKTETFSFHGHDINVPVKAQQYIVERYGENWQTPDKEWVYWRGPSTSTIPNKGKQLPLR